VKQVMVKSATGKALVTKYSVSRREADSIRTSAKAATSGLTHGQRSTIAKAKSRRSS